MSIARGGVRTTRSRPADARRRLVESGSAMAASVVVVLVPGAALRGAGAAAAVRDR